MRALPIYNYKRSLNFYRPNRELSPSGTALLRVVICTLLALTLAARSTAQKIAPKIRPDLSELASYLCQQPSDFAPDREGLWQQKIFDVDVQGSWVEKAITAEDARAWAKKHDHLGFGWANCTPMPAPSGAPKNGWLISAAAPSAWKAEIADTHLCPSWNIERQSYLPHKGWLEAVGCRLEKADERGATLWYLVPRGGLTYKQTLPPAAMDETAEGPHASFLAWTNSMRLQIQDGMARQPLRPMDESTQNDLPSLWNESPTVAHSRRALERLQKRWRSNGWHILGEDRLLAPDRQEGLWLLWNSPSHRRLLLRPDGTHLAEYRGPNGLVILLVVERLPSVPWSSANSTPSAK